MSVTTQIPVTPPALFRKGSSRRSSVEELHAQVIANMYENNLQSPSTSEQSMSIINGSMSDIEEDVEDWGIEDQDFDFFSALVSRGKHKRDKSRSSRSSVNSNTPTQPITIPNSTSPQPRPTSQSQTELISSIHNTQSLSGRRHTRIFFKRAGSYGDVAMEKQQALAVVQTIQHLQHTASGGGLLGGEITYSNTTNISSNHDNKHDLDDVENWDDEEDILALSPRTSITLATPASTTTNTSSTSTATLSPNVTATRAQPNPINLPTLCIPSYSPNTGSPLSTVHTPFSPTGGSHSTNNASGNNSIHNSTINHTHTGSTGTPSGSGSTRAVVVENNAFWETTTTERRSTVMDPQKHPRSFSIDRDAKVMGLNTQYLQRLALPLLRNEIYSFFSTVYSRFQGVCAQLQQDPVRSYTNLLDGMKRNALETSSQSVQQDFQVNVKRVEKQVVDLQKVIQDWKSAQSTVDISDQLSKTHLTAPEISSPQASPPNSARHATQPNNNHFNTQNITSTNRPSPNALSGSSSVVLEYPSNFSQLPLIQAIRVTCPFVRNRLNQLCRYRDLMRTLKHGFEINAGPDVQLEALPTTNSNVEGLRILTMAIQALDALVDSEGGTKRSAARISLCFQRLANTLLERHNKEEHRWTQQYQGPF